MVIFAFYSNKKQYLNTLHIQKKREIHRLMHSIKRNIPKKKFYPCNTSLMFGFSYTCKHYLAQIFNSVWVLLNPMSRYRTWYTVITCVTRKAITWTLLLRHGLWRWQNFLILPIHLRQLVHLYLWSIFRKKLRSGTPYFLYKLITIRLIKGINKTYYYLNIIFTASKMEFSYFLHTINYFSSRQLGNMVSCTLSGFYIPSRQREWNHVTFLELK